MRFFRKVRTIPWWGWALGLFFFIMQFVMYNLGNTLSGIIGTKPHAWLPKLPFIDGLTPMIPAFSVIYLFSYIFWICAPAAVSLTKRSHCINYLIGLSAAYVIGFLIFTFFPTYMDRVEEGLTTYHAGNGFFDGWLAFIYSIDGGERAFNLLPSYHCLISVYSYLGVRNRPEISRGYRIYSAVMAILICLSTQFVRQHYFLDLVTGVSIAILCDVIVRKIDPGTRIAASHQRS